MVVEEGGGGVKASELKGLFAEKELEERDKNALFDKLDKIDGQLKIIGNMICDSQGRCRLATKEELERLRPADKGLEEYSQQELWDTLKVREGAISDLAKIFVKKFKEDEDLMRRAAKDEAFREKFLESVCTTEGCRQALNEQIEEARKKYPEEKQSWMIRKK